MAEWKARYPTELTESRPVIAVSAEQERKAEEDEFKRRDMSSLKSIGGGGTRRNMHNNRQIYEESVSRRIGELRRQGLDWTAISNLEHEPRHEPYGDTYYQSLRDT